MDLWRATASWRSKRRILQGAQRITRRIGKSCPATAKQVGDDSISRDGESNTDSKASIEYKMYLYDAGDFQLVATLAPSLNFVPGRGLRFAVSVDDGPRTVVDELEHNSERDWEKAVSDGVRR